MEKTDLTPTGSPKPTTPFLTPPNRPLSAFTTPKGLPEKVAFTVHFGKLITPQTQQIKAVYDIYDLKEKVAKVNGLAPSQFRLLYLSSGVLTTTYTPWKIGKEPMVNVTELWVEDLPENTSSREMDPQGKYQGEKNQLDTGKIAVCYLDTNIVIDWKVYVQFFNAGADQICLPQAVTNECRGIQIPSSFRLFFPKHYNDERRDPLFNRYYIKFLKGTHNLKYNYTYPDTPTIFSNQRPDIYFRDKNDFIIVTSCIIDAQQYLRENKSTKIVFYTADKALATLWTEKASLIQAMILKFEVNPKLVQLGQNFQVKRLRVCAQELSFSGGQWKVDGIKNREETRQKALIADEWSKVAQRQKWMEDTRLSEKEKWEEAQTQLTAESPVGSTEANRQRSALEDERKEFQRETTEFEKERRGLEEQKTRLEKEAREFREQMRHFEEDKKRFEEQKTRFEKEKEDVREKMKSFLRDF